MNWKPEVKVNGNWEHNLLVFATKEEAERSARNLYHRWTLCTGHRAVESTEPVNYKHANDADKPVEAE